MKSVAGPLDARDSRPCRIAFLLLALTAVTGCRGTPVSSSLPQAARTGNVVQVQELLDKGANPNAADETGVTPLLAAILANQRPVARVLLENGADASLASSIASTVLASHGVAVPPEAHVETTPLLLAIERDDAELVGWLIEHGASVDAASDERPTPLILAILRGHQDIARLLIGKGAALDTGSWLAARVLAEAGAPVRGNDRFEARPLQVAVLKGDVALVDLMLERGADVNVQAGDGITPLFVAVFVGNAAMVRRLLDAGAQVNRQTAEGFTPLLAALEQKKHAIIELLLKAGARPDAAPGDRADPLQVALAKEGLLGIQDDAGLAANIDTTGADPRLRTQFDDALLALLPARLEPRGLALDLKRGRIYWTEYAADRIRSADLEGRDARSVVADEEGPIGIAVDAERQLIFWTSDASYPRRIRRAGLDGSSIMTLAQGTSVNRPRAIAVDGNRGEVVWTETVSGRVLRAAADGTGIQEIFSDGISSVADRPDREAFRSLGLAIAPRAGRLYWTELTMSRITQADRSSSAASPEVATQNVLTAAEGVEFPVGIAVDEGAGVLYWADVGRQAIFRAGIDGRGVTEILGRDDGVVEPYAIALDAERAKLYWTDASRDVIGRANLDGTSIEERSLHDNAPFAPPHASRGCPGTVRDAGRRYLVNAVRSVAVCLEKVDALKAVKREEADAAKAVPTCVEQLRRWAPLARELRGVLDTGCRGTDWKRGLAASANPLAISCSGGRDVSFDRWVECTVEKHREVAEGLIARHYLRAVEWLDEVRPFLAARAQQEGTGGAAAEALDALGVVRASLTPRGGNAIIVNGLPATGQSTSYAAATLEGAGKRVPVPDDSAVRAGRPPAFRDNADGTVTDLRTGLMWEKKCAGCGGLHDLGLELPWSGSGGEMTIWDWQANLNTAGGAGFAGYADWRLPNVKELQSIIDYERFNPAVTRTFDGDLCGLGCTELANPQCSCTSMSTYWSSTTFPGSSSRAIVVAFNLGLINERPKNELAYVRAVRGGMLSNADAVGQRN